MTHGLGADLAARFADARPALAAAALALLFILLVAAIKSLKGKP